MSAALIRTNGFRWKICWRPKPEYRDGSRQSRRFVVFQYRKNQPKPAELRALARQHPRYEFRVFRIGEGC